jgi:hypothetical protein
VEGVVCGSGGEGRRLLMLEVGLPVAALCCAEPPPLRSGREGERTTAPGCLKFAGHCRLGRQACGSPPGLADIPVKPTCETRAAVDAHEAEFRRRAWQARGLSCAHLHP